MVAPSSELANITHISSESHLNIILPVYLNHEIQEIERQQNWLEPL